MTCCVEDYKNYEVLKIHKSYDTPVLAGNFRFLLGLFLAIAGFYVGLFTEMQGHGLGLLLFIGSPFVIFKDGK